MTPDRHQHQYTLFPSSKRRYAKKNWTAKETTDPIIVTSNEEAYGEARRFISPKPETNQ